MQLKAYDITINGLVQGVGFRPFVYRLAKYYSLSGWIENRNDCVKIKIEGRSEKIGQFISEIKRNSPRLVRIESLVCNNAAFENLQDFSVCVRNYATNGSTLIPPDVSVCDECLNDIEIQPNRLNYPFVNCTNCGPRFSIIKAMPYDRENTTMREFAMCGRCKTEYEHPENRRFHAQPNACLKCGPHYLLIHKGKKIKDIKNILNLVCELIKDGKIIAIKGIGGFHLACDAKNNDAVERLRIKKGRERKPFAVLMPDINTVREYVYLNENEKRLLLSHQRPIVLLEIKKELSPAVAAGLDKIGVMMPYTPLHYLIFRDYLFDALVFTSGNMADEPIVIGNNQSEKELGQIADAVLVYNREIYNRNDDSVTIVVNSRDRLIRRSRGFAPEPINLDINAEGIVGMGAESKNCFCVGKENRAILSQHIGDLKNIKTLEFFKESVDRFLMLFRIRPELIAHDLHPDYLSTRYAEEYGIDTIAIQHHHAHIASCMAEHGYYADSIGVSFDGAGLGDDGHIWGGEIFIIRNLIEYERYAHIDYIQMPGGDKAINEPWRMAISYLYKVFKNKFTGYDLPFLREISPDKINLLISLIEKKVNSPLTSSMGRLFDAVSAILNICLFSTYEAEAPMKLEKLADDDIDERYEYSSINDTIDVTNIIRGVVKDVIEGIHKAVISTKFHNTVVSIILDMALKIRNETNINAVILSGGIFQNSYILRESENILTKNEFDVYTHSKVPANDGGIALGQLIIAARKRDLLCV